MPDPPKGRLSRRGLLAGVGAGTAGAVALGHDGTLAAPALEPDAVAADRFGRMFPNLPAFAPANDNVRAAMTDLGRPGGTLDARDALERGPIDLIVDPTLSANNRDNQFHTAGTTFLGQFLDHDMTFDTTSRLGFPTPPETSPNARTPALDLDSVYGGGPVAQPALYNPSDTAKLRIESGGLFEDLPRAANGTAIIADPRNDENLMIAGLQAAFILFHNRVVDLVRSQGTPPSQVFTTARRTVTWHYQWIIVNEFLRQICGFPIVTDVLAHGRRSYRPEPGPAFIPVEFQGAVYRFGHSMVRPSYRANLAGDNGGPFFGFIFDPAEEGKLDPNDLRGGARARRRFIGWQTFFDFRDGQVKTNKRIDRRISTALFRLPLGAIASGDPPTSLPQRNLLRHITWSLPSGQAVATAMGIPTLDPGQLPELTRYGLGLERNTPLWYYTLAESELISDGIQLGPMSARLTAEVFIGLLQLDPNSYLSVQPSWRPTLPSTTPGDFKVVDLLRFARVDPASRGQ
ncbi:MAG TPA: heme peroxidase family protein [Candidatus Limnocylindrales bacterium]|nr:heme peroxidase family protein [Candidatus Limnocylindrales bacterium]